MLLRLPVLCAPVQWPVNSLELSRKSSEQPEALVAQLTEKHQLKSLLTLIQEPKSAHQIKLAFELF